MTKFIFICLFIFLALNVKGQFNENQFIFNFSGGWEYPASLSVNSGLNDIPVSLPLLNKKVNGFGPIQNYAAGFIITLHRPTSIFGANFNLSFYNRALNINWPEFINHRALGIRPELTFKLRNNNIEKITHPFIIFGASYNYNFSYKEMNEDKIILNENINILNNGITGILGIGIEVIPSYYNEVTKKGKSTTTINSTGDSYFSIALLLKKDLYNFFNQNYLGTSLINYSEVSTDLYYFSLQIIKRGKIFYQKEVQL